MHTSEKRLLSRIPLGEVPRGAVALLRGGQRIEIDRLRDISHSGISFSLHQALAVSEQIAIAYADTHVKVEVFGRVAWCSQTQAAEADPQHGARYLMGVELLSPMMLYAVLPRA
jgi:hypothetical protein